MSKLGILVSSYQFRPQMDLSLLKIPAGYQATNVTKTERSVTICKLVCNIAFNSILIAVNFLFAAVQVLYTE